jgi:hypothetical protein
MPFVGDQLFLIADEEEFRRVYPRLHTVAPGSASAELGPLCMELAKCVTNRYGLRVDFTPVWVVDPSQLELMRLILPEVAL